MTSAITDPSSNGITAHAINDIINPNIGAIRYIIIFACVGKIVSFANNFTPSANGCNSPKTPTTLGPFLNCIDPNTFLSAKVTYAMAINRGTIIANTFIIISIQYNIFIFFIIYYN